MDTRYASTGGGELGLKDAGYVWTKPLEPDP